MDRLPPLKPSPHLYLKSRDGDQHYLNLSSIIAAWWTIDEDLYIVLSNHSEPRKWDKLYGEKIMSALKMYHEAYDYT